MVRLGDDLQDKLEEIKKYYGHSSDAQSIRKAIEDAYQILQQRKLKDKEIFGSELTVLGKMPSGKTVEITSEGFTDEEIRILKEAIDEANKK